MPAVERVLPSASVKVAPVAGAVIVTLLMLVALATPSVGVVSIGLVARAMPPDPVTARPKAAMTPVPVVMVAGAKPAPPPTTREFATRMADEAQDDAELKYGTPPLVPATVRARVPAVVIGDPETEIRPPVKVSETLVTPVPAGTDQDPSPRRKLLADGVPVAAATAVTLLRTFPDVGRVIAVVPVAVIVTGNAPE